jgi:twitching motility protein PilT
VNQREIGSNTKSFANALRAALREDPDVILVGEMRDRETIELGITAAETGTSSSGPCTPTRRPRPWTG